MKDPAVQSAKRQAALIRRGDIGCLELLDHYIGRVERLDGQLNAVVARDFSRARKRARALDRRGAVADAGALHGVPMTVKESFNLAGLPTTWGVPERRDHVAAADALAVDRLQAHGAVVFGKTNVPIMLGDWQSFNDVYGVTVNPWDAACSPGGSSGGGAAALAAGLTGLEVGSDIGGSVRQPAHACGVFGHKPTWGLLPSRGHSMDPEMAGMADIAVIGPLARSAEDLPLAMAALAGPDPLDSAMTMTLPAPRFTGLKELRVAVWPADPATRTDDEITAKLHSLARHLRGEGARVSLTARPKFDPAAAYQLYRGLLGAALSAAAAPAADALTHSAFLRMNERRMRMRRAWSAFFQDWDVLLCPAHATAALPHRHDASPRELRIAVNGEDMAWDDMLFWPGITGAFHLPASVAPLGMTRHGLPLGVQIVGPLYGDRATIAVARLLERSWLGFSAPPGWN